MVGLVMMYIALSVWFAARCTSFTREGCNYQSALRKDVIFTISDIVLCFCWLILALTVVLLLLNGSSDVTTKNFVTFLYSLGSICCFGWIAIYHGVLK